VVPFRPRPVAISLNRTDPEYGVFLARQSLLFRTGRSAYRLRRGQTTEPTRPEREAVRGGRKYLRICALLAALSLSVPSLGAGGTLYDFRIPRADAGTGLKLFAQQSDTPLLFLTDQVRDRETNPVEGAHTVREALDLLLRGTGIRGEFNRKGVLTITVADPESGLETGGAMTNNEERGFVARLAALVFAAASTLNAGPATAQASAGLLVLEEVVVTAQKREQSLQDVGIAVTALSEELLRDVQVGNILDLQGRVPGLTLGQTFGFSQIMIRGVGTDNPFAGGDPSVALHVDGAVVGQSAAQLGTFFDLERVEVLRGPQGTLYGRNTTGGSVNLITAKPTGTLSGYGRFTAGSHELLQFEGAVSGPLMDQQLLGRIAVKVTERGGYGKNRFTGDDVDDASRQSVRAQLHWLPTDAVDILVSGEYHREDDNNYMPKFRSPSYPDTLDPRLMPQPLGAPHAANPHDLLADSVIQNERDYWSVTGTMNWRLNDRFTLSSITNYQEFERVPQQDFDFTAATFYTQSEQYETWQVSEELRLHYEGERVNGLVGLYYYRDRIESDNRLWQNIPVPPCGPVTNDLLDYPIDDLCFHFRGHVNAEAWAAFWNFNFAFTDNVTINVGGRYSDEKRDGFTDRFQVPGGPRPPFPLTFADSGSFSDFSPRVGVEWKAADNLLIYATYAEGFKSGILLSGQMNPIVDPETVETYEVGFKSRLLDNRLQFNLSAFFYNYTDLQIGRSEPAGATGFTLVYENAARAEVKGVEIEASWLATDQLRFEGSLTYLDATFEDFLSRDPFDVVLSLPAFGGPPAVPQQLAGNRLVQAPEWTFTLRGEYSFAVPYGGWNGALAAEVMYKDEVFFTPFNHPELGQDDVLTVNANLRFTSPDERWYLNLWGRNLGDETVYVGTFIINGSRSNAGALAPPRTFGATLGYNF
jgi:iron complex outermembrane receptor protein